MKDLELTIYGTPRSKKNSQQIIRVGGKPRLIQSKAYREYEKDAVRQIEEAHKTWHIDYPCNVCSADNGYHRGFSGGKRGGV